MACPDLRATQGPEGKVGSLARAYARFVPNFGPQAGRKWTNSGRKRAVSTPEAPWVEIRPGLQARENLLTSMADGSRWLEGGELRPQLFGAGEEVAGVRVLSHKAQRLALAAASEEDPRPGHRERLRGVERPGHLVVLALERSLVVAPHLQDDLDGLLQALEAFR